MILGHGIGGRLDLPIPLLYFTLAAITVLVVTFAMLSARWHQPRLQNPTFRVVEAPPWMRLGGRVFSAVSVVLLALMVLSGFLGSDDALENPAPVLVFVGLWLVVPFLSALVGDFYQVIAPWRVLARWLKIDRAGHRGTSSRVGYWPAAAVLFVFTWWELVSPVGSVPWWLAVIALIYTLYMLVTIALWGSESQLTAWDGFGAYNYLMGAIGPLGRNQQGELVRRKWLTGLPMVGERPGLDALAVVLIGGVTYDGLTGIPFWRNQLAGPLEDTLSGAGLGWQWAEAVVGTFGLVAVVLMIGWAYHVACGVSAVLSDADVGLTRIRIRFAHTLVPIALAYAFAHYFTLVIYEGQFFLSAIADPFDMGWDVFGIADRAVDYTLISPTAVWYIQLAAVIAGHVGGVILAHDRALVDFPGVKAIRSQYPMLALMVVLTMLALFILTAG